MASERVQRQIDRLLDEAEEAISRFDWEAVRQVGQAVLAIDPMNADAITYLASADRALGATISQSPQPADTLAPRPPSAAATAREAERRQ